MLNTAPEAVDAEAGFTLIEMVVVIAVSMVVLLALTSIMVTTLHQTQRTFTQVDASRQARSALAKIENELHSACVGPNATPIEAGSDGSTLRFLSYTGDAAAVTKPQWHVLSLANGALVDTTYATAPDANGDLQPTGTGSPNQLLENVTTLPNKPMVTYYEYTSYPATAGKVYWVIPDGTDALPDGTVPPDAPITLGRTGLASDDAASTVEVVLNLNVFASSEDLNRPTLTGVSAPVTDAISLRLTAPPNEVSADAGTGSYEPCQ